MSSPAPLPTIPTPRMRSVPGSIRSLVSPSIRSSVMARPDAAHGNFATVTARPVCWACVSVSPAHAISGSVKTTAGIARGAKATCLPAITSTATRPSCDALWASIGSPTTSPMANIDGSPVRICSSTLMKPRASSMTRVRSRPGMPVLGRRPTATSTRSKSCSLGSLPSHVTRIPAASAFIRTTRVLSRTLFIVCPTRFASTSTRSRSAPGSRPPVISTTVTALPSVA